MAEITRPDMSQLWASGGAVVAPSASKIERGWVAEIPPHQWENFVQNRQDSALGYLLQRGIPEWDSKTEYFAGKSVVLFNGYAYIATANNVGQTPPNASYWRDFSSKLADYATNAGHANTANSANTANTAGVASRVAAGGMTVALTGDVRGQGTTDANGNVNIATTFSGGTGVQSVAFSLVRGQTARWTFPRPYNGTPVVTLGVQVDRNASPIEEYIAILGLDATGVTVVAHYIGDQVPQGSVVVRCNIMAADPTPGGSVTIG